MRISDWSSDVCSSDLEGRGELDRAFGALLMALRLELVAGIFARGRHAGEAGEPAGAAEAELDHRLELVDVDPADPAAIPARLDRRLEDRKSTRLNSSH